MPYQPNTFYHIYNQGNNRQPIFFTEANYLYFLRKAKNYLTPYVDIVAYCLMPNHFHFLVYTKEQACHLSSSKKPKAEKWNEKETQDAYFQQALSAKIGLLVSSYTKAINRQEGRSGSLFRCKTKAKCFGDSDPIIQGTQGILPDSPFAYAWNCFHYIHRNPVEAGLVKIPEDWPFSSARYYLFEEEDLLCRSAIGKQFLLGNAA